MSSTLPRLSPAGPGAARPITAAALMARPRQPVDEVLADEVLAEAHAELLARLGDGDRAADVRDELEPDAVRRLLTPPPEVPVGGHHPVPEQAADTWTERARTAEDC